MKPDLEIPRPVGTVDFIFDAPKNTLFGYCRKCYKTEPMPHPMSVQIAEATGPRWGRRRRRNKARKHMKRAWKFVKWSHFTCSMFP